MVIEEKTIKVNDCRCLKCDYKWTSRSSIRPVHCPSCNNRKWWLPKTKNKFSDYSNAIIKEVEKQPIQTSTINPELPKDTKEEVVTNEDKKSSNLTTPEEI